MRAEVRPEMTTPYADAARFRALTEALPAMLFMADRDGRNTFTNERTAAYSGVPVDRLLGHGWLDLVHSDDRALAREAWRRAVETGRRYECECRFRRHDGEYRSHACRAEPVRGADGGIEWLGVCVDIEEQRRAQAELRDRVDDLQTLLDTLPVGVFIAHDQDCRVISGNRKAAEMLRLPQDRNLSKSAKADQVPMHFRILKHGCEIPTEELPVQRAARGQVVDSEEVDHEFDDGTLVQTVISARPLYDAAGSPRGAVASVLNVTSLRSAEASNRRKAEFLAELSHELRNPLAPLTTALELLQQGKSDPEQANLIALMDRQLAYLVSLVDDLLDVARVSRGEVELQRWPLDLRSVVETAIEIVRPLIDERRHQLIVQHADYPLPIDGDERRLTQVVVNLLTNAARYTAPGGTISVRTERDENAARVRVRDTGFGIPPEKLEAIFEMFARVPEHRLRTGGSGLGIGLALARKLLGLHGGTIDAHSEGPDRGSEFVVTLPLAEAPRASRRPAADEGGRRHAERVLVVDDNVDAAESLAMWLEGEGHVTEVAHDGATALAAVATFSPGIVLLDIGLPSMDGYEVARRIRALSGREVRLVALTGWGQLEDRRRSLEAGFDEHLTKPVRGERLRRLLTKKIVSDTIY